jgi:hypothetical protein
MTGGLVTRFPRRSTSMCKPRDSAANRRFHDAPSGAFVAVARHRHSGPEIKCDPPWTEIGVAIPLQPRNCVCHEQHGIVALAFPPTMVPPPQIGEEAEFTIRGKKVPLLVVMGRNTALRSCASMAGLVIPAGMTSGGLPVGLEFDALTGNDRTVLALGLSVEKVLGPIPAPKLS